MNAPTAIAIALVPERLVEPEALAVLALSTVGVGVLAVAIPPGAVNPPPSEPPPAGDGNGDGAVAAAEVTLVEAVAECLVLPAASAAAGARTIANSEAKQATAQTRTHERPTRTNDRPPVIRPSALGRERLLHRGRGRWTLVGLLVLL